MADLEINGKVLEKYNGSAGDVIIPEGVTVIKNNAFSGCKTLKSVTIPASVKEIQQYAFCDCKELEQVNFSEGLQRIGRNAFYNCTALKSITIPRSIREISMLAFSCCESLEQINLPEGLTKIGTSIFRGCCSLVTVKIPSSVEELGQRVFSECESLEQVNLPANLKKISSSAFYGCNFKAVTIPATVQEIGEWAYGGCESLESITFEGAPKIIDEALGTVNAIYAPKAGLANFVHYKEAYLLGFFRELKAGKAIDAKIIENNKNNVKTNAKKLYNVKSDELFGYFLEYKLIPLKDVDEMIAILTEAGNTTRMAALIDYKENNFTEVQLDRNFNKQFEVREPTLTELKALWTFSQKEDGTYYISRYKGHNIEVEVPAMLKGVKVTEIESGFLSSAPKVKRVMLPDGIQKIAAGAFESASLEEVTLPKSIEEIGGWAFKNCKSLKAITIPKSIKRIRFETFQGCESLEEVNLPDGLIKIDACAFEGCQSLKSITIPASVRYMEYKAFSKCTSLEQVKLFEGLLKIGYCAFGYCKSLKTIVIPASVKTMGETVFEYFSDITVYCVSEERLPGWAATWDEVVNYNSWEKNRIKLRVVWGYKGE